ncbi:putative teichuronic acid biosynthesis glycosyltransferase TuaH [Abditibacteriota bacterium]|nr:putative teichuronic acid biosynthesis glycosyltransferase TuaH [Abditibacteriota bacterium]
MSPTSQNDARDIVFVSLEAWDEVWRRNQFLVAGFLQAGLAKRVLWVEPPRNLALWLIGRLRGQKTILPRAGIAPIADMTGVFRFAPPQPLPNTLAPFRWVNERVERYSMKRALRQMNMARPLLWVNNHWAAHIAGHLGESGLIYDITDDWLVWERTLSRRQRLQRFDALLCERADATIVCSPQLLERKRGLAKHLHLVPNGVDAAHYSRIGDSDFVPHPTASRWKKPVLGYLGTVHPDRVDVEMVAEVARAFPDATVALVGPNMLPPEDRAKLEPLPNVVLTGSVSYADVPTFLTAFDVALVPHVETPFTQSLNPIKLGEYLAAGLPVVSTRVAGFVEVADEHPTLLRAVSGNSPFLEACHAALAEGNPESCRRARRELAQTMSWDGRVASIARIVEDIEA